MQFLRQTLTNSTILYNPQIIQTSVAVIVNNDEILLIKRKVNARDPHSGQIAFPGGKVEKDENTFQAAIRETFEEIGVNLNESHHLGRIDKNYQAYYIKNKNLKIATHIFQLDGQVECTINENEVDRVMRLPLNQISLEYMDIKKYKNKSVHVFARTVERQKYLSDIVMQGFQYQQFPYYKLEKQVFYGLSWLVLCDVLQKLKLHQDVVDYTFQNYHYGFENNVRKEQFFDEWFKKKRLNQFIFN
ncbi:unnamed protein product [Paramecium pentaurelia]|uniref:Nudix hydrolase domain-containing protein n=1 Tax=Paramecium pentaurelia TaxID=43138 RepID=A0A8S1V0X5_9CILI|nr:unnamed protein product [Paramecium pentaurelia]